MDFTTEAAEIYLLAFIENPCLPKFIAAVSGNALVFGTEGFVPAFCLIAVILSLSGRTQIGISIIQAVAIDVIHEQMVGEFAYLTMHEYLATFSIFGFDRTYSVRTFSFCSYVPFVFRQAPVIVRVDDCILALRQRYPAEGVAVANPPVQKHRQPQQPYKPERYGYGELNFLPPGV